MAITDKRISSAESLATISNVLLSAFIVASLYFGQELLVPLALAVLLAFIMAPLVTWLQRWLGRIRAVLFVVMMIFAATGGVGWVLTRQTIDLANKLPGYKENIQAKLRSIPTPNRGPFSKIAKTIEDLKKDLPGGEQSAPIANPGIAKEVSVKATPVEIVNRRDQRLEFMQVVLTPVLGPLGTAALVLLLLIFMLFEREDLRNRIIKLIGQGHISTTSQAMDEAGARVSKYLLMQIVVNVTYGIPVAIGLYFIGVPNAILWGALASVLRFIPYIGPWIAASFPILLSLASSPGWMPLLLTIGLFIVLELISNNVMEPWLYGSSTGVTPMALILAALVWTSLWGPVGLILATPLTVCLVVMGRHIPKLAFLSIILSDDEVLTTAEDCYRRLLRAGEHDEIELVEQFLKTSPLVILFDSVLLPVAAAAGKDYRMGILDRERLDFVEHGLSDILMSVSTATSTEDESATRVCCVPAKSYRDQLAGDMLILLLGQANYAVRGVEAGTPISDQITFIKDFNAEVAYISVVTPTTLSHARQLCLKLRLNLPDLKIVVGLWGRTGLPADVVGAFRDSGADEVVMSLAGAVEWVEARSTVPSIVNR